MNSGYTLFFLAPSISILELLWISFIQSPGSFEMVAPWDGINQCWIFRLGSSHLSWCCSSFAIPYLGGSKVESDFISMKLVFKIGEKGWLWLIERLWTMWNIWNNVSFCWKYICNMKSYKVIFIFSSTFARNSGDIGRRLPKVRLSRFAVFLTLVVAGPKPLRYNSRCHGECHAVVVSPCSNANFDPNVKDGDDETSLAAVNVTYFSHRPY